MPRLHYISFLSFLFWPIFCFSFGLLTCACLCVLTRLRALRGRARTNRAQSYKKNSTLAREMPKNIKIFPNFHKKRGLAGKYGVYSGVFEVCCPPHLSSFSGGYDPPLYLLPFPRMPFGAFLPLSFFAMRIVRILRILRIFIAFISQSTPPFICRLTAYR